MGLIIASHRAKRRWQPTSPAAAGGYRDFERTMRSPGTSNATLIIMDTGAVTNGKNMSYGNHKCLMLMLGMAAFVTLIPVIGLSESTPVTPYSIKPQYEGRIRMDYDYRSEGGSKDSDLYGYWYGSGRDLANGRFDFYVSGREHTDLDGSSQYDGTFRSVDDAKGVTENRLLQAYGDVHDRSGRAKLRLGRQYIDVADYLQLDGGQATLFENGPLGGRVYFGAPVSYYTSVSGDFAGGASLVGRPWTGNQTRLTWAEYYDDSKGGDDQNYFVDLQQEVTDSVRTRGQLSVLNDKFRMAQLDGSFFAPDGNTDLHVGGSRWGEFDAKTRAYSPLYNQFGTQQPYTYLYSRLSYAISPKWMLSPGVSARLADSGNQEYSNRDYRDYDVTLTYEPCKAVSSSLSLQYWDVDGGDSFLGLSGEVRYRYRRIWEVSAGSAYVDYTYQSYSDISYSINGGQTVFRQDGTVSQETPYTLTYFVRTKWNVTRKLILRLQGDLEDRKEAANLAFRGRGSVEVRF
jgi:hypothetical protein